MGDPITIIFIVLVLIISASIHEASHGYAAEYLGDPTARLAGRLTLNPMKHLDLFGSFIFPLLLIVTKAPFLFAWAKPVPYNPYNLKNQRWGEAIVAGAGPLSNIAIAVFFGLVIRFSAALGIFDSAVLQIIGLIVYINLLLALFNLIPFPPLDGSKVFASILPYSLSRHFLSFQNFIQGFLARYGIIGMIVVFFLFIFIFMQLIWPFFFRFITFLFSLITGAPFFF